MIDPTVRCGTKICRGNGFLQTGEGGGGGGLEHYTAVIA